MTVAMEGYPTVSPYCTLPLFLGKALREHCIRWTLWALECQGHPSAWTLSNARALLEQHALCIFHTYPDLLIQLSPLVWSRRSPVFEHVFPDDYRHQLIVLSFAVNECVEMEQKIPDSSAFCTSYCVVTNWVYSAHDQSCTRLLINLLDHVQSISLSRPSRHPSLRALSTNDNMDRWRSLFFLLIFCR